MKGYRTVIFNVLMGVVSLVGLQVSPDTVQHWAGLVVGAWMVGGIVLRFITTTPAFKTAMPVEVQQLAQLIAANLPGGTAEPTAVADLTPIPAPAEGAATITGPPGDLVALATEISQALSTIQLVHDQAMGNLAQAHQAVSSALPAALAAIQSDTTALGGGGKGGGGIGGGSQPEQLQEAAHA
ncbi:hypothetical protein [Paramagnetospirillum magneticum]|uniref:Uncharacterized protein n=1 Tax=Paramagnetospirillum magneticum (strain ATCC 700264 / AMB-1) TaxID=342108 RepID=Q2WA54_PARM1|nr:hypothetical protein [Paramagnetospirillum magneticum]BAE49271.1 hypothetical protein amb0467 [Paramagnetospirillum magneticum AMB-1]